MKALTKIVRADPRGVSLRTTVPLNIVETLKLKAGDSLLWDFEDGIVKVSKA